MIMVYEDDETFITERSQDLSEVRLVGREGKIIFLGDSRDKIV